jgi:stage II sporulation protein D
MKYPLFIASFLILFQYTAAQSIHIGLFNDQVISSAVISCATGKYNIESEDGIVGFLDEGDIIFVKLENDSITLHDSKLVYGRFHDLKLNFIGLNSSFRVRPIQPVLESRTYDDNLILNSNDRFIILINHVDFDKYLSGVVEAEGGPNSENEYYKAQSVLCRTFATKYLDKHATEGFSLCDGVHCQAYKGKSVFNPGILEAIEETSGLVLLNANNQLITASYHSNSGGQTQRAADVWITDEPYLQSVIDPFSLHQPSAKWYDTISFKDWKDYLYVNGMKSVTKIPDEIIYVEQMRRKKFFILDKDSILMTKIREDWGFKSTFFDMFPEGDSVVIWGKGYGHGIGMSQEGAMKMARDSYLYKDILQFYFFDVKLMNYEDLPSYSIPEVRF